MKEQSGAVRAVMDMSVFVLLLLSGLLCSAFGLWRDYHYINKSMSWSDAQSYCRARFTDLATVDSMNDVNRTMNTVNEGYSGSVWIGLKRATQSRWVWSMENNTLSQYINWKPGEPDFDGECVGSSNGSWFDKTCSTLLPFVCYNGTAGFIFINMTLTWRDAQSYCRRHHTDLASVSSPEQQRLINDESSVWIGLFLHSWQWSDHWSLSFRYWTTGQPSNSSASANCVAMATTDSGNWAHDSCDLQRPFICHGRPKPLYRPYHYINTRMSWSEAQSYCRESFTDLATVDSMNDVNRTMNKVNDGYSGSVWIGLKRGGQHRWGWSNGENTISQYSNWDPTQPNQPLSEFCVFSTNGGWHDMPCNSNLTFVCYNESSGYIMVSSSKNWRDAQSYCRQYHTDLATVSSPEEKNQQSAVVGSGRWVWIGLFLDSWWWSDQWSLFFRNWAAGQPSASGDCVAMSTIDSGKWIQDSCDLHRPFLCYGRPKPLYRPYYYINTRMSWSEAQSYCRVSFTDLATVDTMNDVNRMINTVKDGYSGSVWIGLKRGTQRCWGWSNGDDTYTQYRGWGTGQPSGDGECGELKSGAWNDLPCSTNYNFVCYNVETIGNILIQTPKNWRDAQSYCRQYHTDLATVSSPEAQQQLYNLAGYGSWVWIGLFLDSWQWSDQWSLFFRNWAAGQPSASGDCVAMSAATPGKWAHGICNLKRPFFCHGWPKPLFRHYHYINKSMSWSDAQSYCRVRFTDLATVDSTNDVNRTMKTVNDGYSGSVWIGLKRATQSRWVWSMENNTLSQYINWKPGEPDFDGECVGSSNGSWFDKTCSTLLPFVCYNGTAGFIFINMTLTWRDAQSYCRRHHTDLASVSSPEQQRLINDESSVWIGLFLHSWQWSDHWSLSFRYWTTGQPSNSSASANCVAMATTDSGNWAHDSCDLQRPFICHGRPKPLYRPYHYINTRMSWSEAQSYCRESFTDLATVDSMNDVNRTMNKVNDGYSGSVWIGLKRGGQHRWGWSNGENTISQYSNWDPTQPNQPLSEFCVFSYNGAWHDMPCNSNLPFVCCNESSEYIMVNSSKNWRDAQSYCRQYHTDLATVSSPEAQQQLYNLAGYGSWVWIGLFLDSWRWSDQWSLFFRNWAAGQPSASGDCVAMSTTDSGKWTQYSCDHQRPFICYGRPKLHRHYLYVNKKMSWSEAQSYCRVRFTDLATVDSMNDVNRMLKTVKSWYSGSLWIGLKRATQSRWRWSSGDDTLKQYSGWQSREPNGDAACVFFANGFWNDYSCSNQLFFVCYNGIGNIVISMYKNWTDAQSYCRQYHTDLATISSPEEQKQLYSVVGNGPWVWIGLFFDSWQWSDQWSLFNFRYWATGYTSLSSGSGDCVAMSTTGSGKWIQDSCDQKFPFICYGDDDIIKRQIGKLLLSCDVLRSPAKKCSSGEPLVKTAILNKIREKIIAAG
ncbi:lymphocyte antigen 75-like isoform X2 [Triplophysa rosa]|nr:lymphocyte antigen 75-like isoform X2 [Triplophysa rosa]